MDSISKSLIFINNLESYDRYKQRQNQMKDPIYDYENWRIEVKKTLLEGNFKDAFYSGWYNNAVVFGILGTFISWGLIFYSFPAKLFSGTFLILALILWIESIVIFFLPEKMTGHWTSYGLEYYKKWMNFKKYIEDYSLMEEYPPESVKIWDKYMVYATALGVAKGVRKSMELSLPESKIWESNLYILQRYKDQNLD